jgi:hypothetical protein
MILYCRKCGHIWKYTGASEKDTSCPKCKSYVNLEAQRVDAPLGDTGDYGGSVFLGVSQENSILYYDRERSLLVEYFGEPDPYSRVEETYVPEGELVEWLKDYHWDVGLRFRGDREKKDES